MVFNLCWWVRFIICCICVIVVMLWMMVFVVVVFVNLFRKELLMKLVYEFLKFISVLAKVV